MTFHGKTTRYVEEGNLKWLPKSGKVIGGNKKKGQKDLVLVQLDVAWVKRYTCSFNRLMGRR